jgi:hypothetical protein
VSGSISAFEVLDATVGSFEFGFVESVPIESGSMTAIDDIPASNPAWVSRSAAGNVVLASFSGPSAAKRPADSIVFGVGSYL